MTIALVTGGAGFIGSHLVRDLLDRGVTVRALDDLSTGDRARLAGLGLDLIVGDVCDENTVRQAAEGVDWIFHLAAIVSTPASLEDPVDCYRTNVLGSLGVLEAARRQGAERVVLSSSCAVYGDTDGPVSEEAEPHPLSPYASSKLAMEGVAQLYARVHRLPTLCLRYFNVFGPGQSAESEYAAVIPQFIDRMRQGEPAVIEGDGEQTRDFVHVRDVVYANWLAANAKPGVQGVVNIGSGHSRSVLELVQFLQELVPGAPSPLSAPPRPGDIRHSEADLTRATELLGFRPQVAFEEGLRSTVSSWRPESN